jgi:hypothetical protein
VSVRSTQGPKRGPQVGMAPALYSLPPPRCAFGTSQEGGCSCGTPASLGPAGPRRGKGWASTSLVMARRSPRNRPLAARRRGRRGREEPPRPQHSHPDLKERSPWAPLGSRGWSFCKKDQGPALLGCSCGTPRGGSLPWRTAVPEEDPASTL